ncbi:hypothetical protein RhiirA1_479349 [Rhizophagus irregularis]|uniref:Uncharacterized protein n=1 Tax=Rhizophagus irregularis TaxID=588596 RepID=A0A2N0QQT0_9GLOM|nr:hypothetical protein RhiirA1_479349 [Rhizophagus irregularis]CAB4491533.1 unnamed protein product [Rhizophagus irregularis]CAB5194147.1 unnamed protein product [Rhizophagus irregularis]
MSGRKRLVSALLSNNEESITARSSRKSRVIFKAIDEESEESTSIIHIHNRRIVPLNVIEKYNPLPSSFEDYSNPLPSLSEDYGNPLPEDNLVSSDKDSDNNGNVIQRMEMEEIDNLLTDLLHRQRSKRYVNQQATITEEEIPPELFITDEESSEIDEESKVTCRNQVV